MISQSIEKATIPNDYESEQAVLGSIIYDNETINDVVSILKPVSFYSPSHQHIYRAMLELVDLKQPIDELLLGDQLKSLNQLEEVGGYAYLATLQDCVPGSGNTRYYAKIIQEHAVLRQLISTTTDISRKSRDPESESIELIDEAISKLMEIRENSGSENIVRRMSDIIPKIRREVELASKGKIANGLLTNYHCIDKMTSIGLLNTELIIIGARPSMGKTSLAMCIGYQVVVGNKKCLFISLESEGNSLARDRFLPAVSGINSYLFRSGNLDQGQWDNFDQVVAHSNEFDNFKICDKTGLNCNDIYSLAKIEYEQNGLDLLIVDYVQLVKPSKKHARRDQELGEVAEKFKDIAKDFNIPVIALSQLNRDVEKTKRRPNYADLRDSGELEQIADVIMLIHQDDDPDDEKVFELIFGKNRNGKKGPTFINFLKEYTRFENI